MKSQILLIAAILIAAAALASGQVTFVQPPSMVSTGANQWTITFEVSQNTDVEVSIVNIHDSTVVRHLAAGLLGAKAPLPFAVNALSQSLLWDGKNDYGKLAANPENLSVRVRAGMTPRLVNFAGENLYDNLGTPSITSDGHGGVYILSNVNSQCPLLRKYDASGNYVKTLYPPPANLPADSVKSYKINVLPGGGWVPKTYPTVQHAVIFTSLVMRNATINYLTGKIRVNSATSGQHIIDTNGCFTDTFPNALAFRATPKPLIPGAIANLIETSAKTGAFYAITGNRLNPGLAKYTGSKTAPTLSTNLSLSSTLWGPTDTITSIAVAENGATTNIFVGFNKSGVRIYADNGTGPKLMKPLAASIFHDGPFVFERVAVNRNNDCVYWNGSNVISDWRNPISSNFQMERLDNITPGPDGRFLYGWLENGAWSGIANIRRISSSNYAQVPYGNTGNNCATGGIYFQYGAAGTPGNHRGIAVGWQGQLAVFTEGSYLIQIPDTGGLVTCGNWDAVPVGDCRKLISCGPSGTAGIMEAARQAMMGVKYDAAGNYYVGLKKLYKPIVPSGFGTDLAFRNSGSIVKFRPESTATFNPVTTALTGYEKIYPQPYGPFSTLASGPDIVLGGSADCTCRNSYFDVDPYGRLYIPNGVTCQVYVVDNAGNNISVFGQYGNTDSRGALSGPGELISMPDIPLGWPTSVGASEDFVYIGDLINARLVRVQMAYDIDNIPGLTLHGPNSVDNAKTIYKMPVQMSAAPNPFHPISNITLSLITASHVDLSVYDVNGRLVKTLAAGSFSSGTHCFSWDARNAEGREVSAGVYIYKLEAGKHVLIEKAIFAK